MLSPKYLEALPQPIIKIYSEFENELLGDIAKRITKADYLTPTAEWRLYKAEQLRLSSREITQKLARLTGRSEKEIRQLYTGALKEALRNDEKIYRAAIKAGCLSEDAEHKLDSYFGSVAFSNALKAGYRNTNGLMRNLCNSAAAQANSRLSDELDKAFLKVASGAYTADEAVYSAVQDLGKSGIKVINYSSGHKDKVDVAVRRAVITGIGQAAGNMQLSLAADMGCDLVEVTAHLGARPSHAEWQGRIFSLSGKHPKYPDFRSSTGYGTGAGLCGWNCRHSFYPYFEGLSKPNGVSFTREENDEVYRNTQKQRAYERAVRQSKRELAALDGARSATDDETLKQKLDRDFRRKAVTLKRREAKLEEHLRNTGLLPDNSRVRVDGFGRSVSQKAVWAVKKKSIAENNSGKPITLITDTAIGKVKTVEIPGYSAEQNDYIRNQHLELLKTSRDENNNNEVAFIISNGNKREAIAFGIDDRLDFSSPDCINALTYLNNLTVLHNHPKNGSFSDTDIRFFIDNTKVKHLTIVKNNGTIEVVSKDSSFDERKAQIEFIKIYKKTVTADYKKSPQLFKAQCDKAIEKFLKKGMEFGLIWTK